MPGRVLLDGIPCDDDLVDDRGLHYGDGVFETMAWRDGDIAFFTRHMRRLGRGCAALGFQAPDEALLRADLAQLACGDEPCVIKLVVTRGRGGRGYLPDEDGAPRRLLSTRAWPEVAASDYASGIAVTWLAATLARQSQLAGVKHLCRLEQVLAARELAQTDANEGLLCDRYGAVIEAVSSNVFMLRDDCLLTPVLTHCGVAGIMREIVLETAADLGIACEESVLRRADFAYADEVFLSNSIRGILPVRRIDKIRYSCVDLAMRISQALVDQGVTQCGQ